jgi:hypothetical protein
MLFPVMLNITHQPRIFGFIQIKKIIDSIKNCGINNDMKPSIKSFGMETALKSIFGVDRRTSINSDVCVACDKPATNFKDVLSRKEFCISGLCQECQDKVFGS